MIKDSKKRDAFFFLLLLIFLLLDIIRPFGYLFCFELLFLGIIFISLYSQFIPALILSIIFGYLKDSLSFSSTSLSIIEFPLLVVLIHYILSHFSSPVAKIGVFLLSLFIHIILNGAPWGKILSLFSLLFFIQSSLIFFLLDYFMNRNLFKLVDERGA